MGSCFHPRISWLVLFVSLLTLKTYAGGSGFNTVVIANQASSNSCELANYYCQQRQIPPQNVLYINWTGGNISWTSNDLQTTLVNPLLGMLASRQLSNQIQYVVLSMDIPFQTADGSTVNSTTSALFYGLRLGDGTDPLGITNSYAASEGVFGQVTPVGAPGYSFLTTMITGGSLAQAEQLVDQGVAGDATFPQQPVVLAQSDDTARNIRYVYFNNAIFNVNILDVSSILRTNTDSVSLPGGCMGYETGLADFDVPDGTFVSGAIADSLTSFGGVIFGSNSQTNELAFIAAGAAGSYGTVAEPDNDTQKFPNPQVYFYQARGFSLAESYYQSVNVPYLGLMVAEPLSAPFAEPGYGQWNTNLLNSVLSGTTNLSLNLSARVRPLQQVDLFVDGVYYSTLTNLAPTPGNLLTVNLNGYPVTYTVPVNATLNSIATGLAALINSVTNATQVTAAAYGDRIQLECTASNPAAVPFYVADTTPSGTPGLSYEVNYLSDSVPPQMMPGPPNRSGAYTMQVDIPGSLPYVVLASTNLSNWQPLFTNLAPGLLNFTDWDSTNYSQRFYRMAWPAPDQPVQVTAPEVLNAGQFQMLVSGIAGEPWAVQASPDLVNWASIFTNQAGGTMEFVDPDAAGFPTRFYRAVRVTPPSPSFSVLDIATNLQVVRVGNASLPYTVGVSTNAGQWTPLATNFAIGRIQTTTASAAGNGNSLSTFLNASQPVFMESQALGRQSLTVISNAQPTNAWIQLAFTMTNGQSVVVAVTNQSGASSVALVGQLFNAINANPALQGADGVEAEDFVPISGSVSFNLYARSPGLAAAALQVQSQWSSTALYASGARGTFTLNLSDLQPRNHLYVTVGSSRFTLNFPLATTDFPDGYHELTAVAYEGSDVRTETLVSVPVQIQNSSLTAMLTLLTATNVVPVQDTCQFQVTASTNNVSLITLFTTGGAFATATNQSTATFEVAGTNLWAGLHPFYAVVQTAAGLQYRTQTQWVTFTNSP